MSRSFSPGIKFKLLLADYFAFINNKLEGNLDNIRVAGEYFAEIWKACGLDSSKIEVVWSKDMMERLDYWDRVLRVGKAVDIGSQQEGDYHHGQKGGRGRFNRPAVLSDDAGN